MTVNFRWGAPRLAWESSSVTIQGRIPPSTAEAKTARDPSSLSAGSLSTGTGPQRGRAETPAWINECGATSKVTEGESLPVSASNPLATLLCPGRITHPVYQLALGWVPITGATRGMGARG